MSDLRETTGITRTPEAETISSLRADLVAERAASAALRDKADQSAALLVAVEKLLETDETINWPQPHPEILSAAAGARLTLRMWADEINDLKAKVGRLKSEAAALRESNKELAAALEDIRTHGDDDHPCEHTATWNCHGYIQAVARTALAKATEGRDGAAPTNERDDR